MPLTLIGVRHHSPACSRLVVDVIRKQRPRFVLVEGPADMNDRLDELLLQHAPPIAIFTSFRDAAGIHRSWAPLCEYSPEWVALREGAAAGATLRFIDLPAWHPALSARENRYADAELRYGEVIGQLCRRFAVDNADTLWDHMVEAAAGGNLEKQLSYYFDLLRSDAAAAESDSAREDYMAGWIAAACRRAGRHPVVAVTGGFHRPALVRLLECAPAHTEWPPVPGPPDGARAASYLVPYSYRRLDAFSGYEAGMPSPGYYDRLWRSGAQGAAAGLMADVVGRLRARGQVVSTADLVAASSLAHGLARLRGHAVPARTDVLDGLAGALVTSALEVPLPWTGRGALRRGSDPVAVEMVAALSGDRVGSLHPDTPTPPLVHDALAELERHRLDGAGDVELDLGGPGRERSRLLHRLRILHIPGFVRTAGPATGLDPVLEERWQLRPTDERTPALIEAGAYGSTVEEAGAAVLAERSAGGDLDGLASVLFDAALAGITELGEHVAAAVHRAVGEAQSLSALGGVLAVVLGLWRHDRLLGTAGNPVLGAVLAAGVDRALWLAEGIKGGPSPADERRLAAVAAVRDCTVHGGTPLGISRDHVLGVMRRIAADASVPPDLRGAALGLAWSLGEPGDPLRALRGAFLPGTVGDWLTGLFALAREEVLTTDHRGGGDVIAAIDEGVGRLPEHDFMVALPALRQAFEFFPPREREVIARRILARRGLGSPTRSLLRTPVAAEVLASARSLEARVDVKLRAEGLLDDAEGER